LCALGSVSIGCFGSGGGVGCAPGDECAGEGEERDAGDGEAFVGDFQAAEEHEPCERCFDDPAAGSSAVVDELEFLCSGAYVWLEAEPFDASASGVGVVATVEADPRPDAYRDRDSKRR